MSEDPCSCLCTGIGLSTPRHDPACPAGGVSFCTIRQGDGDVGENIASTEGDITVLDIANVRHEEVMYATWTNNAVVVGPLTTETDMGTHTYVVH